MNQELFEKHFYNHSSHYEKYARFLLCKGSHHVSTPVADSKDERNTKEVTGRMHSTYCGMPKGTSWAKAKLTSEKLKSIPSAIVK